MEKDPIEFYDVKHRIKIMVPRENCELETIKTKRGERTRITGFVRDNPGDPERKVSKLCSKDFQL